MLYGPLVAASSRRPFIFGNAKPLPSTLPPARTHSRQCPRPYRRALALPVRPPLHLWELSRMDEPVRPPLHPWELSRMDEPVRPPLHLWELSRMDEPVRPPLHLWELSRMDEPVRPPLHLWELSRMDDQSSSSSATACLLPSADSRRVRLPEELNSHARAKAYRFFF